MVEIAARTAFITGGANGIGLGIARALSSAGAKLALADLDAEALDRAKRELSAQTEVETVVLDVRDREAYARAADALEARLGPVSLLFTNAGVVAGAPARKLTFALWDWGMDVNLGGVINGVQIFLPRMIERSAGGHIVNTASGAGLVAAGAGIVYHTAKFAVVGMSEALRMDLAPANIGITVLCPGTVATNIIENTRKLRSGASTPSQSGPARADGIAALLAQGADPDEVGRMVLRAVQENRLYIHTDRLMYEGVKARCEALLDAMPQP